METESIISSIGVGIMAGAIYGFAGYQKAHNDCEELNVECEFDVKSFLTTVIASGVVGGLAAYAGMPYSEMNGIAGVTITQFVKKVYNAFVKDKLFG